MLGKLSESTYISDGFLNAGSSNTPSNESNSGQELFYSPNQFTPINYE